MTKTTFIDKFGRSHDYLRISLLERCNLRCHYCMPEEGIPLRDKSEFMSQEELFQIVDVFVKNGIRKIRLTGGEPLIKKNFSEILAKLAQYNIELNITTNGVLLDQYWTQLKLANVKSLNISLDSLIESKFNKISRRNYFNRIFNNIQKAVELDFEVKVNVVLMKGENDDEVIDFVNFTKHNNVNVRFIEFMPFNGNNWDHSRTVGYQEIIEKLHIQFGNEILSKNLKPNATSRDFSIKGHKGSFGIISSVTNPFCDSCNRIRLTADGKIKNCLFSNDEINLLEALRKKEDILPLIQQSIGSKKKERGGLLPFDAKDFQFNNRSMTTIGG